METGVATERSVPLVVDLDGTLQRSDVLLEDISAYVFLRPLASWRVLGWYRRGDLKLQTAVAATPGFDPARLPYNDAVLGWLATEHTAGRRLVLVTAATRERAQAVADHLGIFSDVIASDDGVTLRAEAKRDALVARFGAGGYEYVDRKAAAGPVGQGLSHEHPAAVLLRAVRPQQWLKNLLIFVALFTAHDVGHLHMALRSVVMFVCFCMAASSAYILNDMADVRHDRHHPTKRNRPFASGEMSLAAGWTAFPALLVVAFALSGTLLPLKATIVLLGYLIGTLGYTFYLKRQPVIDVVTLAGLYTIRVVAGAAAIGVYMTIWLLSFSIFLFASLAIVKRVSELQRLSQTAGSMHGRGYRADDIEMMRSLGVTSGFAATIVFALYVNDNSTDRLYRTPHLLWLAVPVILYWCCRLWLLTNRGEIDEDPVLFAARDRVSIVCVLLLAAIFVAAKFAY